MRTWLVALAAPALALLLAAAPADLVKATWTGLAASPNTCEGVFDYFPDGGLRILWCHAKATLTGAQLAELTGSPVFVSGPHKRATSLDLKNHAAFGRYDPAFVKKLPQVLIPAATDPKFREATQSTYDTVLKSRARNAWVVHEKLARNKPCAQREREAYQANMKSAQPNEAYYERWYDFLSQTFCDGEPQVFGPADPELDGNVTKTLTGWWLRRQIDGTEPLWVDALKTLLQTYDGPWLAKRQAAKR